MADPRQSAITLVIGGIGALVALVFNMPMGLLAGPAVAVAIAGLCGVQTAIAAGFRNAGFLLVGLSIGSMIGPDSIQAMMRWPIAFFLLAILTLITPWIGRWLLPRILTFDRDEAFLGSAPGHLSLVIALADSLSLSLTRPVVLASIRLMALTLVVPLAAQAVGMDIGAGLPRGYVSTSWAWLLLQIVAALALSPILHWLKLPAPTLLAGILVAASTHLSSMTTGTLPDWLAQGALVLMGSLIGTRFSGMSWHDLSHSLLAGLAIVVLTSGLAALFAVPAAQISGLPVMDVLLGFAPGGLETMVIVAAAMGADPSFVAAAHVFRLLILAFVLTLYATHIHRLAAEESDGQRRDPRAD
ncbi:AbrB family transcriptional regulator [Parasedimentitalea marina]|uniref:AbrB family transcriptional regulator n=1 Tax=Parasedimentitalea marina TaxID=2483033 RepID=A0A3T0MYQ4_9RHOB|nr:AbrB family transcriptional regulator [Parasedimentitalea marina]AZV76859.1 AbrB family transcriptional regulator [Parasedimentitalea marina]